MDNNNQSGSLGDPKRVFRLLPRPTVKPATKGEDPKEFFRLIAREKALRNQRAANAQ